MQLQPNQSSPLYPANMNCHFIFLKSESLIKIILVIAWHILIKVFKLVGCLPSKLYIYMHNIIF